VVPDASENALRQWRRYSAPISKSNGMPVVPDASENALSLWRRYGAPISNK
jgi:hypothetical protein